MKIHLIVNNQCETVLSWPTQYNIECIQTVDANCIENATKSTTLKALELKYIYSLESCKSLFLTQHSIDILSISFCYLSEPDIDTRFLGLLDKVEKMKLFPVEIIVNGIKNVDERIKVLNDRKLDVSFVKEVNEERQTRREIPMAVLFDEESPDEKIRKKMKVEISRGLSHYMGTVHHTSILLFERDAFMSKKDVDAFWKQREDSKALCLKADEEGLVEEESVWDFIGDKIESDKEIKVLVLYIDVSTRMQMFSRS